MAPPCMDRARGEGLSVRSAGPRGPFFAQKKPEPPVAGDSGWSAPFWKAVRLDALASGSGAGIIP